MKALVGAAIVFVLVAPLAAEQRYDRRLEEAVMAIVASRVGDIRGGFALDAKPVIIVVQDDVVRATQAWESGPAVPLPPVANMR